MVDQHFVMLTAGEPLRNVVSANLADALRDAACEVLNRRYPRHPQFSSRVTRPQLEKALKHFETLVGSDGQRMALGKAERAELELASDLGLVTLSEGAAQLRPGPLQDVQRALEAKNLLTPQVAAVYREFDPSGVRGLTPEVKDFLVLAFSLWSGRELLRGGRPLQDRVPGKLPADAELVRPVMPEPAQWQRAVDLAGSVFGIALGGRALNARNLRTLSERLDEKRRSAELEGAGRIAAQLLEQGDFVAQGAPRLKTAEKAAELLSLLAVADEVVRVGHIATFVPETSAAALQRHFVEARNVTGILQNALVLSSLRDLGGRTEKGASELLQQVRDAFGADQLQVELASKLQEYALQARDFLRPVRPPPLVAGSVVAEGHAETVAEAESQVVRFSEALKKAGPAASVTLSWRITRKPS